MANNLKSFVTIKALTLQFFSHLRLLSARYALKFYGSKIQDMHPIQTGRLIMIQEKTATLLLSQLKAPHQSKYYLFVGCSS